MALNLDEQAINKLKADVDTRVGLLIAKENSRAPFALYSGDGDWAGAVAYGLKALGSQTSRHLNSSSNPKLTTDATKIAPPGKLGFRRNQGIKRFPIAIPPSPDDADRPVRVEPIYVTRR